MTKGLSEIRKYLHNTLNCQEPPDVPIGNTTFLLLKPLHKDSLRPLNLEPKLLSYQEFKRNLTDHSKNRVESVFLTDATEYYGANKIIELLSIRAG